MERPEDRSFRAGLEMFRQAHYQQAIELWERLAAAGFQDHGLDLYLHAARMERARTEVLIESATGDLDRARGAAELVTDDSTVPSNARIERIGVEHYVAQARALVSEGKSDEAIAQLREALVMAPEDGRLHLALSRLHCAAGRIREAEIHAMAARNISPDSPDPDVALGLVFAETGRVNDAQACFERALSRDPKHGRAWVCLIDQALSLELHGRAAELLVRAIGACPDDAAVRRRHDDLEHRKAELDDRIESARRVVADHPDWADWQFRLGQYLVRRGEIDGALDSWATAIRVNPAYARCLYERALVLWDRGDELLALADLKQAAELSGTGDEAYVARARQLERAGLIEEAVNEYRVGLRIESDTAGQHVELARQFIADGLGDAADRELDRALLLREDYPDAHALRGLRHSQCGRWALAETSFKEALSLNPRYVDAGLGLAEAHLAQGRVEAARITLETCVRPWITTPAQQQRLVELGARLPRED